jgi:CheY-like chemotaxis protein
MKPEQLEKIFLPFEQVGNVQKQVEGTGLGLAISQRIVGLMQGEITVESELGKGSTFTFAAEFVEAQNWAETSRVTQHGNILGYKGDKRTILVIDDRWENRSVLSHLLEPIGFTILEASNGQEGLAKTLEFMPDLIITDLAMPVMDGFEFLRKLRIHPKLQDRIVLVSSASVFDVDRHKSLDAGANDFLPKPVPAEMLLALVQQYLQLEWVYDEQPTFTESVDDCASTEIQPPAIGLLQQLSELAQAGDLDELSARARQMQAEDPALEPFAKEAIRLAETYEVKQLRVFIQQYLS